MGRWVPAVPNSVPKKAFTYLSRALDIIEGQLLPIEHEYRTGHHDDGEENLEVQRRIAKNVEGEQGGGQHLEAVGIFFGEDVQPFKHEGGHEASSAPQEDHGDHRHGPVTEKHRGSRKQIGIDKQDGEDVEEDGEDVEVHVL